MVRVLATGVFDLLHPGHLHYMKEAKSLGDELIVVVATDRTVRRLKHEPINPAEVRRQMVESLKPVDRAVLGYDYFEDKYQIVREIQPDIIALGYDQTYEEEMIRRELKENGIQAEVKRVSAYTEHDLDGTRRIINRIIDWWGFEKKRREFEEK